MAEIPAPLLSRQVGGAVVVLSVVAATAVAVLPPLGFWPFAVALVLAALHHAFIALAVLIAGRTGLAGRHRFVAVVATFGSAGLLLVVALAEIVLVFVVGLAPDLPRAWLPLLAVGLTAATGALLTVFGVTVVRAAVVAPAARILPLVGGLAVLAVAAALYLDPVTAGRITLAVATLLLGGIGLALFTPRRVPGPTRGPSA